MEEILSTQSQRFLKILDYLYYNESSTIDNLVTVSNTTTRTIREDINKINHFIKPLQIKRTTQFDYYLTHKNSTSCDFIYSCILKESLEFSVLEKIFFEEEDRLEDYANALFISLSTLKRIISKINKQIKNQGVKITSNPVQIVGDEHIIRSTMIHFFREKYLEKEYLFDPQKQQIIDTLITNFIKEKNIPLKFPDFEKLRLILYVALPRIRNGHFHSLSNIDKLVEIYSVPIIEDTSFKYNFKENFNIDLTPENFVELAYPVTGNLFTLNLTNIQDIHKKDIASQERLFQISQLINDISDSLQINLDQQKKEVLILELFNMKLWTASKTYLIYNAKHIFLMNIRKDFPRVYDFFDKKIISSSNFSNYKTYEIEEFIYMLITHWDSLLRYIQDSYKKFTVGVVMHSDIEHSQFLIKMLEKKFERRYSFESLNYVTHDEATNYYKNYDVILTNISTLKEIHPRVITIAPYPSLHDLEKIYRIYYDLCNNKETR